MFQFSFFLLHVVLMQMMIANLNMEARTMNGPEDAQDYLWLTQDLWMASDVWNWANENQDVMEAILRTCEATGCEKKEKKVAEFKRCAACHLVREGISVRTSVGGSWSDLQGSVL